MYIYIYNYIHIYIYIYIYMRGVCNSSHDTKQAGLNRHTILSNLPVPGMRMLQCRR